jgi:hypothetical protein
LNILTALYSARPNAARRSWLWRQLFQTMQANARGWAATGIVTEDGSIRPVVVEPKFRACLQHGGITQILTPHQPNVSQRTIERLTPAPTRAVDKPAPSPSRMQVGFAAEEPDLRAHRCRHIAHALMALSHLGDHRQMAANLLGLAISVIMLVALPDLRSILWPHPAPLAVAPASTSPYELWVSLDTKYPRYFCIVFESGYWSNRRAEVKPYDGVTPSVRAEVHFHRLTGNTTATADDGDVWIERRRRFLTREYYPGERVGHYSIPYLSRLGHE